MTSSHAFRLRARRVMPCALTLAGLSLLLAAAGAPAAGAATKLYVSPSGSDTAAGTKAHPFATLQRAQQAVRGLTAGMTGDVVVQLRGGRHELSAPLQLSDAAGDSGENGHRVVWRAYRDEQPVLSGGRTIAGWSFDTPTGVWSAAVGDLETRQLYVDGQRATRAALGAGLPGVLTHTPTGYVTTSTVPQAWSDPEDIELLFHATPWTEQRCGVASITGNAISTTITMDQPCFDRLQQLYPPGVDWTGAPIDPLAAPSAVDNSGSFLTEPGTFHLDRSTAGNHVLRYLPRTGEDLTEATVIAPVLEALVAGSGTAGDPLHDVALKGLTFADATWLAPSGPGGFVNFYIGMYANGSGAPGNAGFDTTPGAVAFEHAERIAVTDSRFVRLGASALSFARDSSDGLIRGNRFTDVSGTAVQLGALAPESAGLNHGNRIADNRIHAIGVEYPAGAGILVQGTQDTTIAHNDIDDVPYTGIAMLQSEGTGATASSRQRALNNEVTDAMQVLHDGGGVYVAGTEGTSYATGAVVRGNVVHGLVTPSSQGLYPDYGPTWVTVRENVSYGNTEAYGICAFPPYDHVRYVGNFWDDDQPNDYCGPQAGITFSGNTLFAPATFEQDCALDAACAAIVEQAGLRPQYEHLLTDP